MAALMIPTLHFERPLIAMKRIACHCRNPRYFKVGNHLMKEGDGNAFSYSGKTEEVKLCLTSTSKGGKGGVLKSKEMAAGRDEKTSIILALCN